MPDFFDALREHDANRVSWISAARAFERAIQTVTDQDTVKHLERLWREASEKPLADMSKAWELVEEAHEEIRLESPLTLGERAQAERDGIPPKMLTDEARAWVAACRVRGEQISDQLDDDMRGLNRG